MDTIISENIIYKCTSQGMMLKLNNVFENNIVADILAPPRGYYLSLREGPLTGARIKNNIFYSTEPVVDYINELGSKKKGKSEDRRGRKLALVQDADADYNLYYCKSDPKLASDMVKEQHGKGVGKHSIAADPLFQNIEEGNFTLAEDSPALKLGFKPIDQSTIGLIKK